jgi:hypothetical protein
LGCAGADWSYWSNRCHRTGRTNRCGRRSRTAGGNGRHRTARSNGSGWSGRTDWFSRSGGAARGNGRYRTGGSNGRGWRGRSAGTHGRYRATGSNGCDGLRWRHRATGARGTCGTVDLQCNYVQHQYLGSDGGRHWCVVICQWRRDYQRNWTVRSVWYSCQRSGGWFFDHRQHYLRRPRGWLQPPCGGSYG